MAYKFTAKQECLEAKIIEDVEKQLKDVPPIFAEMNCNVTICRQAGKYRLSFKTGFETVSAVVDHKGRYRIQVIEARDSSLQMSA